MKPVQTKPVQTKKIAAAAIPLAAPSNVTSIENKDYATAATFLSEQPVNQGTGPQNIITNSIRTRN